MIIKSTENYLIFSGLMSSIALGGCGFGAAIWIPIETTFVNPNDIEAVGLTDKYFEDPRILENIPKLFLLLGGIFAVLQIIGLLLLQEVPEMSEISRYCFLLTTRHLCNSSLF